MSFPPPGPHGPASHGPSPYVPGYFPPQPPYQPYPPPFSPPHPSLHSSLHPSRSRRLSLPWVTSLLVVSSLLSALLATLLTLSLHPQFTGSLLSPSFSLPATPSSPAPPSSLTSLAASLTPAVVEIEATSLSGGDIGSGSIISPDGYVLTNNHVVAGASLLTAVFSDGTKAPLSLVGADPVTDLAVVKIRAMTNLPTLHLGTATSLQVGQPVLALGAPLGLSSTLTTGVVSALHRTVDAGAPGSASPYPILDAIQTDASINPGNSGGPLVDYAGNVVGVTSAIATLSASSSAQAGSIGLGFAIPIDTASRISQEIITTGKATHSSLGIQTKTSEKTTTSPAGALVSSVKSSSPAARAGLQQGDVITSVGGHSVSKVEDLLTQVRDTPPGTTLPLTVFRDGSSRTLSITLGPA